MIETGGYHSFGPGGFRETPLADVLPLDIGPAQRQNFGDALRNDVRLPPPVRMRPATSRWASPSDHANWRERRHRYGLGCFAGPQRRRLDRSPQAQAQCARC